MQAPHLVAPTEHHRSFVAVGIGEPQRAVDPGPEVHDMLMNLFGGMIEGRRLWGFNSVSEGGLEPPRPCGH